MGSSDGRKVQLQLEWDLPKLQLYCSLVEQCSTHEQDTQAEHTSSRLAAARSMGQGSAGGSTGRADRVQPIRGAEGRRTRWPAPPFERRGN